MIRRSLPGVEQTNLILHILGDTMIKNLLTLKAQLKMFFLCKPWPWSSSSFTFSSGLKQSENVSRSVTWQATIHGIAKSQTRLSN